jgi:D-alanyl-D-alanine carboxypeptidase (penicillin-binding protein 5/6)
VTPPRLAAACALAAALFAAAPAQARRPAVAAPSAIVVDARTGDVLFQKRPDSERAIASTTKLMTALLTLERSRPTDIYAAAAYHPGPLESKIGLRPGERMRVGDLLTALLLESANDAAVTLAEGVAGSRSAFVGEMNARAEQLGLEETSYSNPIGLDDPGNHSSARDLATLASLLMRNKRFAATVDKPRAVLRSGARRRVVNNRNLLVRRYPFVDGVKTGHTSQAGFVLVGAASRDGIRVVSVVLGEPSEAMRDSESLTLLRYGLDSFADVRPVLRGRTFARARVKRFGDRRVELQAVRALSLTVRRGARVRTRVTAPDELEGPIPAGRPVGTVAVLVNGRVAARVPLVTAAEVPEAGLVRRVGSGAAWALAFVVLAVAGVAALRLRALRSQRGRGVAR